MVVKILSSSSSFSAVRYNTDKMDKGKGELMTIRNISNITDIKTISPETIKNYLKAISNTNKRISKPQFHCAISCKGNEFGKDELTNIAHKYMDKMGYGKQPYLVIFHNDTDNNHVHIVSTRVTKNGKKINDSNEKYRSMNCINQIIGKDHKVDAEKNLKNLLNYKLSNINQLKTLLEKNNYVLSSDEKNINVFKNGELLKKVSRDKIIFNTDFSDNRKKQIAALIKKYSSEYSKEISPLYEKLKGDREGKIIGYESDLTKYLKFKFGLDFVFHYSEDKNVLAPIKQEYSSRFLFLN